MFTSAITGRQGSGRQYLNIVLALETIGLGDFLRNYYIKTGNETLKTYL